MAPSTERLQEFLGTLIETMKIAYSVEHAMNQKRLRAEFGWKTKQIAEFYGCTEAYVSELAAISRLHPNVHHAMRHHGLSINEAYRMKHWNLETQRLHINELISKTSGQITNKKARKLTRERVGASRSVSEVREFFKSLLMKEQPKQVHQFAAYFLEFVAGRVDDAKMEHQLRMALSPQ